MVYSNPTGDILYRVRQLHPTILLFLPFGQDNDSLYNALISAIKAYFITRFLTIKSRPIRVVGIVVVQLTLRVDITDVVRVA